VSLIDRRLLFLGVLLAWARCCSCFGCYCPLSPARRRDLIFSLTKVNWTTFGLAAVVVLEVRAIILLIRTSPGLGGPVLLLIFIISFGCIALTLLFWGLIVASAIAA
jgi:hypothetical protein